MELGLTLRWFLYICMRNSSRAMRRKLTPTMAAVLCDRPAFCPLKPPLKKKTKSKDGSDVVH